jgi:Tat protein secretion system quality control protein TatD with DNase activity
MAFVANALVNRASLGISIKSFNLQLDLCSKSKKIISFLIVLAASLLWECVEHYLESGAVPGYAGERIAHWFQGVEHWSNRLIGDTLAVTAGFVIFYKNRKLAIPAKVFSILWMALHIFVFPDSMYLQRLLFGDG